MPVFNFFFLSDVSTSVPVISPMSKRSGKWRFTFAFHTIDSDLLRLRFGGAMGLEALMNITIDVEGIRDPPSNARPGNSVCEKMASIVNTSPFFFAYCNLSRKYSEHSKTDRVRTPLCGVRSVGLYK